MQAVAADGNDFRGGFRVGFPPTSLGQPVTVTDPTVQFGLGKASGGVAGIAAGGAGVGAAVGIWKASAAHPKVATIGKVVGTGLGVPSGAVGLMGIFAVVAGVLDVVGAVGP